MAKHPAAGPTPVPAQDGLRRAHGTPAVQLITPDDLGRGQPLREGGTYERNPCSGGAVISACTTEASTPPDNPGTRTWEPVVLEAGRTCSTIGWSDADLASDAARLLDGMQWPLLAGELWEGTRSKADGLTNTWLTAADELTKLTAGADYFSPMEGLAALDDALAAAAYTEAVIYTPRAVALRWAHLGLLTREGQRLYTVLGTQVIADRAFRGAEPDDTSGTEDDAPATPDPDGAVGLWIYGTGPLQLRMESGPPLVIPGSLAEAVTRETNDITYRAARKGAWTFDCPHVGARIRFCGTC